MGNMDGRITKQHDTIHNETEVAADLSSSSASASVNGHLVGQLSLPSLASLSSLQSEAPRLTSQEIRWRPDYRHFHMALVLAAGIS